MPLPADHPLTTPQYLIEDATGARFYACNCPSQPRNRTLRHVAANRAQFSLPTALDNTAQKGKT